MKTLEEKLIDIITNHPEKIIESCGHRPGETYVIIGDKRVYFTRHNPPRITGIYKRNHLYGACRKVEKFFQDAYYYQYWLHLFRPVVFLPILCLIAIFYFGLVESEEAKIHRLEKLCSLVTGFKAEYASNGRINLSGTRKAVDGTSESVNVTVDPAGWFFFRGNSELTRCTPKNGTVVTESFDYDGGDVWLHRENKKWIHGKMGRRIRWDNTQEAGARKKKIYGHTIEGDENLGDRLIDSDKK